MTTFIKNPSNSANDYFWIEMKEITKPTVALKIDDGLEDIPLDSIKNVSETVKNKPNRFRFPISWIKH